VCASLLTCVCAFLCVAFAYPSGDYHLLTCFCACLCASGDYMVPAALRVLEQFKQHKDEEVAGHNRIPYIIDILYYI
jgi:hypothetical protein